MYTLDHYYKLLRILLVILEHRQRIVMLRELNSLDSWDLVRVEYFWHYKLILKGLNTSLLVNVL